MVRSHIQDHRDIRMQAFQSLKLERADFDDQKVVALPDAVDHWFADVAAEERLEAGITQKRMDQRDCCRLSVCTGHCDDLLAGDIPSGKLHLSDNLGTLL